MFELDHVLVRVSVTQQQNMYTRSINIDQRWEKECQNSGKSIPLKPMATAPDPRLYQLASRTRRREFLCSLALLLAAVPSCQASAATPASTTVAASVMDGVQVLYNNDGENLWAVQSPYHDMATPVTSEDIRGSVDDVTGACVRVRVRV